MSILWRRASKVASQFKKLKGGRQQSEYLQQEFKLELHRGDILKRQEIPLQRELSSVNKENENLRADIQRAKETEKKLSEEIVTLSEQVRSY